MPWRIQEVVMWLVMNICIGLVREIDYGKF
jgi:hypothetical protein